MSKKLEFPSINPQPAALLRNIARDFGENYTNVLVMGIDEDGEFYIHIAEGDAAFLSMASVELQMLAYRALQGDFLSPSEEE